MTEQKIIEEIKRSTCFSENCSDGCLYKEDECTYRKTISALEEIQKYRKIGTVEEFAKLKLAENGTIWGFIDEYVAYKQIGTVEECREAVEKQKAKKPKKVANSGVRYTDEYICPNCEGHFTGTGIADYCYHCGKAIQWDEDL